MTSFNCTRRQTQLSGFSHSTISASIWPLLALMLLFLPSAVAHAQLWDMLTNPQITVNLTHPPRLGLTLKKFAIGPAWGGCADQIADQLASALSSSGAEVVNTYAFNSMMTSRRMTLGASMDAQSATQLGRVFGPTALIFVKISNCDVDHHNSTTERREEIRNDQQNNYNNNNQQNNQANTRTYGQSNSQQNNQQNNRPSGQSNNQQNNNNNNNRQEKQYRTIRINHANTEIHLRGTIQTVDLATGRIFSATPIVQDSRLENLGEDRPAEYPPDRAVRDPAIGRAVQDAITLFLPWNESKQLYFFDDKPCNLKTAYTLLKAGDIAGTLRLSQQNLDTCKATPNVKDSTLAHAYYNVGLSYLLVNDHERALEFLAQSARLKGGDIVEQTIAETTKSSQLESEMRQVVQRTEQFEQSQPAAQAPVAQQPYAGPAPASGSVEDRLQRLDDLYKKGLINKQEYDQKRQAILKDL